jgi:hypothetical protein
MGKTCQLSEKDARNKSNNIQNKSDYRKDAIIKEITSIHLDIIQVVQENTGVISRSTHTPSR